MTRRSSFSTQMPLLNSFAFWIKNVAGLACRPTSLFTVISCVYMIQLSFSIPSQPSLFQQLHMITDDFSDNIIPGFTQTVNGVFHKHFKISRKPYTVFSSFSLSFTIFRQLRPLFYLFLQRRLETQTGDLPKGGPLWTVGSIVLGLHLEVGLGVLAHRAHRRRALGDLHMAAVAAEPHDLLALLEDLALLQVVQQL